QPGRSRVEEGEWIGLGGASEAVDVDLLGDRHVPSDLALVQLVLAASVRSAAAGLVTLAHGDATPFRAGLAGAFRRRGARPPAGGRFERGDWRRSPQPTE